MADDDQQQTTTDDVGDGDGKPAAGKGEKAKRATRYRVLWAGIPEEADEPLKYREIVNPAEGTDGWYSATNPDTAKRAAFADEKAEAHPHVQRAADQENGRGVILRAVPETSWGKLDPEPTLIEVKRETAWGF